MAQTANQTAPSTSSIATTEKEPNRSTGKWESSQVGSTCYKEVAMLFQRLAVFPNYVVQTQVQLIKRQGLLCVGCCFSCWIVVCFLKHKTWTLHSNHQRYLCVLWKHSETWNGTSEKQQFKHTQRSLSLKSTAPVGASHPQQCLHRARSSSAQACYHTVTMSAIKHSLWFSFSL